MILFSFSEQERLLLFVGVVFWIRRCSKKWKLQLFSLVRQSIAVAFIKRWILRSLSCKGEYWVDFIKRWILRSLSSTSEYRLLSSKSESIGEYCGRFHQKVNIAPLLQENKKIIVRCLHHRHLNNYIGLIRISMVCTENAVLHHRHLNIWLGYLWSARIMPLLLRCLLIMRKKLLKIANG